MYTFLVRAVLVLLVAHNFSGARYVFCAYYITLLFYQLALVTHRPTAPPPSFQVPCRPPLRVPLRVFCLSFFVLLSSVFFLLLYVLFLLSQCFPPAIPGVSQRKILPQHQLHYSY